MALPHIHPDQAAGQEVLLIRLKLCTKSSIATVGFALRAHCAAGRPRSQVKSLSLSGGRIDLVTRTGCSRWFGRLQGFEQKFAENKLKQNPF